MPTVKAANTQLLLSRTMEDPDLLTHLVEERLVLDGYGVDDPAARWEAMLALHAIGRWTQARGRVPAEPILDISTTADGGRIGPAIIEYTEGIAAHTLYLNPADPIRNPLEDLARAGTPLMDVILARGLLVQVPDPDRTLYLLSCLLAPGGLLVLMMPYWQRCGPDVAHGHEARRRIYCPKTYLTLRQAAEKLQLYPFGGVDPTFHGTMVQDHSRATLVLEKRA